MKKEITVYSVTANSITVNYPTKATAGKAIAVLTSFNIDAKLVPTKVEIELNL